MHVELRGVINGCSKSLVIVIGVHIHNVSSNWTDTCTERKL